MGRDIRKEINSLFNEWSHEIVYIRRDRRFHCDCYVERSGESSNPDCPRCFGTGNVVQIEKYRTRRQSKLQPESLAKLRQQEGYGQSAATSFVYYMEHFANAKDGDIILEVQWHNGLPVSIKERYEISIADPQLGYKGRIEFYEVYCRYSPKGANDNEALSNN